MVNLILTLAALAPTAAAFNLAHASALHPTAAISRSISPSMLEIDSSFIAGGAALVVGLGGGIGLIAFTENAGKRNEQVTNAQPCVVCKGAKVVTCTICQGTGADPLANLVKGVREMSGEDGGLSKTLIDDWDSGLKEVVMYEEILSKYPVKVDKDLCENCDGRGVVVCDNCQGTGLQPRFLERYSPDDFMD